MVKTIAFDFDGVIHKYREGWLDGSIYDDPNSDVLEVIQKLIQTEGVSVVIISTRDPYQIKDWVDKHHLFICDVLPDNIKFWQDEDVVGITNRKLPACLYIDDRAFLFDKNDTHLYNHIVDAAGLNR